MTNNKNKKRIISNSDDSEGCRKKIKLDMKETHSSINLNSTSNINEHSKKINFESTCSIQKQDINIPSINTKENRLKRKKY